MDSIGPNLGFWFSIWANKIAFLWSFLFALFVLALAFSITFITESKDIDIILSLSILTPFVIFLYYKRPPEKEFHSLDKLISNVVYLFMVHIFGIFLFWLLLILVCHPYEILVNWLSIIFMIQIFTGFFISVLHGLLPLIKSAKFDNRHFLRLTLSTITFVLIIFLNNTFINLNFGQGIAQVINAIALTLFTTLTVHFIQKNCSNNDEKLLIQSIKVFLIIVASIILTAFIDKGKTQQSIDTLLTLSTSFLLPVAFGFLFSAILVIVDQKIKQSNYKVDTENANDLQIAINNLVHFPVKILFYLIVKALIIPQK